MGAKPATQAAGAKASTPSLPTREVILAEMPGRTGGLRLTGVAGTALQSQLQSIANALTTQYLVTYVRPDSAPTPTEIQAVSKRGAKALTARWIQ